MTLDSERLAPLVLVVDDDPQVCRLVKVLFDRSGFDVITAANGAQAMGALRHGLPDLAIIDRSMPVMDGFELARALKSRADIPILMLTASGEKDVVVSAITAFAEDYVVKPFDGRELIARAQRILRRFGEVPVKRGKELALGPDVRLNFADRCVSVDGRLASLTATEARLLSVLARNGNRVVPSATLLQRVWDPAEEVDVDTLRVHIRRVREKIEPDPQHPRYLLTERGVGYRLVLSPADAPRPVG
jgi:DNA-binding response OmpR family regulator